METSNQWWEIRHGYYTSSVHKNYSSYAEADSALDEYLYKREALRNTHKFVQIWYVSEIVTEFQHIIIHTMLENHNL